MGIVNIGTVLSYFPIENGKCILSVLLFVMTNVDIKIKY